MGISFIHAFNPLTTCFAKYFFIFLFYFIFFKLGFTLCKAEQLLRGMELQEEEKKKKLKKDYRL